MRSLLLLVMVGVSGFTLWWIVSTGDPGHTGMGIAPITPSGDGISMGEIRIVERRESEVLFELMAQSAVVNDRQTEASLEMLSLLSHSGPDKSYTFVADQGELKNGRSDVFATGGIVAVDDEGRALMTESLTMHEKGERLETDARVRIVGPQFVIRGDGMVAYPARKTVELKANVTAVFMPENR